MRASILAAASALAVTACSPASNSGGGTTAPPDASRAVATEDVAADGAGSDAKTVPLAVSLPQLAYSYKLGYRLPGDKVAAAQEAHRAQCERMGPARCQLLALTNSAADNVQGSATLKLRVASTDARSFSVAATKAVSDAGGRAIDTNVTAEDVSKDIVDAQARIAQRELLVSRLIEILRTRTGKVAELVEAERSVAEAQEELDKAKAWLNELRGRVAMSDFEINYTAIAANASAGNTGNQLWEAIVSSGAGFVIGLRTLLMLLIYLLPWALLAIPLFLLWRTARRRWPLDLPKPVAHPVPEQEKPDEP